MRINYEINTTFEMVTAPINFGIQHLKIAFLGAPFNNVSSSDKVSLKERVGHFLLGMTDLTYIIGIITSVVEKRLFGFTNIQTSTNLDHFSDCLTGDSGRYVVHHMSTYPGSTLESLPTDHASVRKLQRGYHIAVADGMGHHEPAAIGQAAAEAIGLVNGETISSKVDRFSADGTINRQTAYRDYLKEMTKDFNKRRLEGTCLVEAEVVKNPNGGVDLRFGQCGDSDIIVLNSRGEVLFATKDIKNEKIVPKPPRGDDTKGLIGVGASFREEWLDHAPFGEMHFNDEQVFVIACSDGLSDHFRNADGTLNTTEFTRAALTGQFSNSSTSSSNGSRQNSPPRLNPLTVGRNLRNAAAEAARVTQRNGDDTTIVVVSVE